MLLDVLVGDELASLRLPKALLDPGDKAQALDGVVDGGVIGEATQGFKSSLFGSGIRHAANLARLRAGDFRGAA